MQENTLLNYLKSVQPTPVSANRVKSTNPEATGVSDDVPAMLSDGEHIVNAEQVSKMGGGATDPGHNFFEEFLSMVDSMDRDTAVTFANLILMVGELLIEEQPRIEEE